MTLSDLLDQLNEAQIANMLGLSEYSISELENLGDQTYRFVVRTLDDGTVLTTIKVMSTYFDNITYETTSAFNI